jgi:hypothetical protein
MGQRWIWTWLRPARLEVSLAACGAMLFSAATTALASNVGPLCYDCDMAVGDWITAQPANRQAD